MKGFFIEVSNDLLDPKHCRKMGDSVWLFMWFLDKLTSITESRGGKVLGGKPIIFSEIEKDLGISRSTYQRWMKNLKDGGYVETLRTPKGSCITVKRAKKIFGRKTLSITEIKKEAKLAQKRENQKIEMEKTCVTSDTSLQKNKEKTCVTSDTSMFDYDTSVFDYDTSNIRQSILHNSRQLPSTPSGMDGQLGQEGENNFTSKLAGMKIFETAGDVPDELRKKATALFLPLFPSQFTAVTKEGKPSTPFVQPHVIAAIKNILVTTPIEELEALIKKYQKGEADRFRPVATSVFSFCKYKFDAIKTWSKKSATGLHAHKSISTPEEAKVRDAQYKKRIERNRAEQKAFEDKWKKEHNIKNQNG